MKTSSKGVELIKAHEGFVPHAYKCPAGVWTIGFGHTGGVKSGDVVSRAKADALLRSDLATAEGVVNAERLRLNQNQFDALVSFVFNVGGGNFRRSTLLKVLKQDVNSDRIGSEMKRWVHGGGKRLPGLVKRRNDEVKLYYSK